MVSWCCPRRVQWALVCQCSWWWWLCWWWLESWLSGTGGWLAPSSPSPTLTMTAPKAPHSSPRIIILVSLWFLRLNVVEKFCHSIVTVLLLWLMLLFVGFVVSLQTVTWGVDVFFTLKSDSKSSTTCVALMLKIKMRNKSILELKMTRSIAAAAAVVVFKIYLITITNFTTHSMLYLSAFQVLSYMQILHFLSVTNAVSSANSTHSHLLPDPFIFSTFYLITALK